MSVGFLKLFLFMYIVMQNFMFVGFCLHVYICTVYMHDRRLQKWARTPASWEQVNRLSSSNTSHQS